MSDKLKQSFEIIANQIDLVNQRIDGLSAGGETFDLFHRFEPFTMTGDGTGSTNHYHVDLKKIVVPAGYRISFYHWLSYSSSEDFTTRCRFEDWHGQTNQIHSDTDTGFTEKNLNLFYDNNTPEDQEITLYVDGWNSDEDERHETSEKFVKISCAITKIQQ